MSCKASAAWEVIGMCCPFYIKENDTAFMPILEGAESSPLFPRFQKSYAAPLARGGEVRPTNLVAVLATDRQQKPALFPMVWGCTVQGRNAPVINARSETAAEKPIFREAWQKHRCVIPASWYFEWQHTPTEDGRGTVSTKLAIQPKDAEIMFLCGLYRIEENKLPAFVILTRQASEDVAFIHERMPLMLPKEAIKAWINPSVSAVSVLPYALTAMRAEPE